MNKGLQWVLGICVVLLTLGWVFTMVAPFFIAAPYAGMLGQHQAWMGGGMGNMMGGGQLGNGMMGGGLARFGGMGLGVLPLLVLGGVGLLGFWLGRVTAPKPTPPAA